MAANRFWRAWLFMGLLGMAVSAQATPKIQHWVLDNGTRVYFVESHDLPMLAVQVVFDAGTARDPADRSGLSMMVNGLLNEGSGQLDADAIAARFEGLGAEFGANSDRDMAGVSLRTLTDVTLRTPALELLSQLLREPSFPEATLGRERSRALLALRQAEQSPGTVATKAFYARLYGTHPYAQPPEGSAEGIRAMTRADLAAFHRRYYTGRNAVLALIGDVSRGEAEMIAVQVAGRLPAGTVAPPLPKVADSVPQAGQAVQVIDHPSTQTHILIGEIGMRRNDPDYFPLLVGNYVLGGGGFQSRLTDEIRTKRGLSYSAYSYFYPMLRRGPFILGLQTANHQRQEALRVARRVLGEFIEQGPTEAELNAARKNMAGGFPLRLDSNRKIAEYLTVIGFYRLPLNYLDEFIAHVEAVTPEQVRDAFRRRIHPEHLVTVIVGGPER